MNNNCVNIAISGLGLLTIDDIKKRLINGLPHSTQINWTHITDNKLDCLVINEDFFENNNIQKIINEKNIPYLKVSKVKRANDPHLLCTPITDEAALQNLIQSCLKMISNTPVQFQPSDLDSNSAMDSQLFNQIYNEYSRKLLLKDQYGTIAVLDHHAHWAWPDTTRQTFMTNESIMYVDATTSDFLRISRKHQKNLENWLFELIWNSPHFMHLPDDFATFRLHYWPQPIVTDQKIILQLSAAFSLGAQVSTVSEKLNISLMTVKKFVIANQAIKNIEKISLKDVRFSVQNTKIQESAESSQIANFFQKLKRRFGF
ncbi:hypothetical protein [Acinetobacter sp. TGL-Y2]|uniref:hypothetical protein n=1 Tax=Acinetobacter sp. TGL-Y2 TaxID=1407071 RepID=UPI000A8D8405|nr:hypothetical protein [Acinetobacter sp. TGL-Y2]